MDAVPFEAVAQGVRQWTHDVRNSLNAIDLQAAFLAETAADEPLREELRKLREMVAQSARRLKELSRPFQPVALNVIPWPAEILIEELRKRLRSEDISIESTLAQESIEIDLQQTLEALMAILRNALQFRQTNAPISLRARVEGEHLRIEVRESKDESFAPAWPLAEWGRQPLRTTHHGHYGLGLFHARNILLAHRGAFEVYLENAELITRIALPAKKAPCGRPRHISKPWAESAGR